MFVRATDHVASTHNHRAHHHRPSMNLHPPQQYPLAFSPNCPSNPAPLPTTLHCSTPPTTRYNNKSAMRGVVVVVRDGASDVIIVNMFFGGSGSAG